MRKLMFGALGAATMMFAAPAAAQELPVTTGDYWDVAAISVDDGHFPDYVDFLTTQYRKENDFSKSKGWIKDYKILANANPREGEPDLYLVTIYNHVTTTAEDNQREKELNAYMALSTRQGAAGSAHRATFRKLKGNMLLRELILAR